MIKHFMGAASLGLGVLGLAKPDLFVRLTGAERDEARGLGFRDLLVGLGIYAAPKVGLAQRALADVGDAVDLGALARLEALGLAARSTNGRGDELSLTKRGRFLGGAVTAELLAA